jgi:CHASE3 domain sensor protein
MTVAECRQWAYTRVLAPKWALHQVLIWCLALYGIWFTYHTIVESTHLYNVKITSAQILRNLIIEESAQRGYLLTAVKTF